MMMMMMMMMMDVIRCRKIEPVTLENVHFDTKKFILSFITHKLIFEYIIYRPFSKWESGPKVPAVLCKQNGW